VTAFGPTLPIGILFVSAFLHPAYLRRNLWFGDWLASGGNFRLNGHVTSKPDTCQRFQYGKFVSFSSFIAQFVNA
jgi:hypothetical protein